MGSEVLGGPFTLPFPFSTMAAFLFALSIVS